MTLDTIPLDDQSGDSGDLVFHLHLPTADPETVLRHFTEPSLVTDWWAKESEIDLDGGTYIHRWPETGWTLGGKITDHRPGEQVSFTWQWDHEPESPELTVTVTVTPSGSGTDLVLRQGSYAPGDRERKGHRDGWLNYLPQLAAVVAGQPAATGHNPAPDATAD